MHPDPIRFQSERLCKLLREWSRLHDDYQAAKGFRGAPEIRARLAEQIERVAVLTTEAHADLESVLEAAT